jgi:hypothetical protein
MSTPDLPPHVPSDPEPDDRGDLDSWFHDEVPGADELSAGASSPSKRRAVLGTVAVVVIAAAVTFAVVLITHGGGSSSAATPTATSNPQSGVGGGPGGFAGRGGGGTVGSISSVSGTTLTIKDFNGQSTKVATTSKTTVTKSVSGAVSDIKVGDHVVVIGSGSTTQIAARQITDSGTSASTNGAGGGFPGGGQRGNGGGSAPPGGATNFSFATGTVKSVNGSTIVVSSSTGSSSTITTSSSTTVTNVTPATVSDLSVGEQVVVSGTTNNGVVSATSIREGARGGFGGRNGFGPGGTPPTTAVTS